VLDFSAPASVLAARINGLFPWPACTVVIKGQPIKFGLADVIAGEPSAVPGTVIGTDDLGLLVGTGAGVLRLRRLQRPGGKMLSAAEFLRGHPIEIGCVLPSTPMPSLVANAPFKK
jgi:methionyl-tRNA formyltransferase